jgi:membrane protein
MKWLKRVRDYLTRDLWVRDVSDASRVTQSLFYLLRTVALAVRGVFSDRVSVWASSLTYTTLIAMVPFLALVAGIGAKLGVPGELVARFTGEIPDQQRELLEGAAAAFENADFRALGIFSVLLLVYTAVRAVFRIERAMNAIWGVKRPRRIWKRAAVNLAVVVITPVLAIGGIALTASLLSTKFVDWVMQFELTQQAIGFLIPLLPYFAVWIALTLLYWLMPNTRVNFTAALVGAIVAGTLLQLSQKGFFQAQLGLSRMNLVFGAFTAIPIFLIWVYVSWIVVLFGTEISYGVQHAKIYVLDDAEEEPGRREVEDAALRVALFLADRHDQGKPWHPDEIAEEIGTPARIANLVLGGLSEERIVKESGSERYRLARPPTEITAADVLLSLRGQPSSPFVGRDVPAGALDAVRRVRERSREALQVSLTEMLAGKPAP